MTLHYTIKDRLSSKILLARQWLERIYHEHTELLRDLDVARRHGNAIDLRLTEKEYMLWLARLGEDLSRAATRLEEDGYTLVRNGAIYDKYTEDGVEYEFLPIFNDPTHNNPLDFTTVQVWQRTAVQS